MKTATNGFPRETRGISFWAVECHWRDCWVLCASANQVAVFTVRREAILEKKRMAEYTTNKLRVVKTSIGGQS
jgi:hypothetical protein